MVQAESYGSVHLAVDEPVRERHASAESSSSLRAAREELMEMQQLRHSGAEDYDVADAILDSSGVHDKHGTISASMAALAAQAAEEKDTGRLTPTVQLPQISKSVAKMAAEAKREIEIERSVDKKRKEAKEAKKVEAEKKLAAKRATAKADTAKVQKAVEEGKKKATAAALAAKIKAAHKK